MFYLLLLVILAFLLKLPWFKEVMGEFIVNVAANIMLDKNEYHLIKNVTLPAEDGTTQIDHVIVSKFGVFVVETKNMKGWIFGGPNQSMWTQKIFKHTSKFQNPLYQNYKHVKTLESLLGLSDQQIHSLIVFVGESTFKTAMPANVTHGIGYISFIKSKTKPVLSIENVREIVSTIEAGRLTPSFKTNREHIRHVKTIISDKQNNTKNMSAVPKHKIANSKIMDVYSCKVCGSDMKMREKKSGEDAGKKYWVCIKFPECRYVETYLEPNWFL